VSLPPCKIVATETGKTFSSWLILHPFFLELILRARWIQKKHWLIWNARRAKTVVNRNCANENIFWTFFWEGGGCYVTYARQRLSTSRRTCWFFFWKLMWLMLCENCRRKPYKYQHFWLLFCVFGRCFSAFLTETQKMLTNFVKIDPH